MAWNHPCSRIPTMLIIFFYVRQSPSNKMWPLCRLFHFSFCFWSKKHLYVPFLEEETTYCYLATISLCAKIHYNKNITGQGCFFYSLSILPMPTEYFLFCICISIQHRSSPMWNSVQIMNKLLIEFWFQFYIVNRCHHHQHGHHWLRHLSFPTRTCHR